MITIEQLERAKRYESRLQPGLVRLDDDQLRRFLDGLAQLGVDMREKHASTEEIARFVQACGLLLAEEFDHAD